MIVVIRDVNYSNYEDLTPKLFENEKSLQIFLDSLSEYVTKTTRPDVYAVKTTKVAMCDDEDIFEYLGSAAYLYVYTVQVE
ncbi:hypothetical protein H6775_03710 [Candidatus Nomurabacteria bacterium]|nr:hypothetical protein [Candidatus Nomurabacteria bacterium]